MRNWLILACLAFLPLFVGCSTINVPIGQVQTTEDKFSGVTIESVMVGATTELRRTRVNGQNERYFFILSGWDYDWRAYDRVIVLADGKRMEFRGYSKLDDVWVSFYNVRYQERSFFEVTERQLREMATAESIEAKVYGRDGGGPETVWTEDRIESLRKFVRLFVDDEWDSMTDEQRKAESKSLGSIAAPIM